MNNMPPEEQNFLPPDPIVITSDRWRNIVTICASILGCALLVGLRLSHHGSSISSEFIHTIRTIHPLSLAVGGDVDVPPPHVEPPALPTLTGSMPGEDQFTAAGIIVKDHK